MNQKSLDIIRQQLETALRLYFEGKDYYSVLTLAGASEGVFGEFLKKQLKKQNTLDMFVRTAKEISKRFLQGEKPKQQTEQWFNKERNALKHWNGDESLEFDALENAREMLARATSNYYEITEDLTEPMRRFNSEYKRYLYQPNETESEVK